MLEVNEDLKVPVQPFAGWKLFFHFSLGKVYLQMFFMIFLENKMKIKIIKSQALNVIQTQYH